MGAFSALNPMLLWGGLAVASPIIIHLLNRRRFRIIRWAAMDFLLQADRQNRRRVRLEDLLLLLLRCLIMLLIALLVARLLFDPTGLGALGRALGRTEHIVVLDDSPSMTARAGGQAVFESATEEIARFLRTVAETRPQDTCTLVLTSDPERPLEQSVPLGGGNLEGLLQRVEGLDPSDVAAQVDASILAVQEHLREHKEGSASVLIVTDLGLVDWRGKAEDEAEDSASEGPAKLLRRLSEDHPGVGVQIIGMVAESRENLGVVDIRPPRGAVAAGVAVPFEVFVRNFGQNDADDVELSFSVGEGVPVRRSIPTVPYGESAVATIPYVFRETGPAAVRVEIESDALPADNQRHFAADVTVGTQVLLVNGEPDGGSVDAETFFLESAFDPPGEVASGFRCTVLSDSQFEGAELSEYHLAVLANVYRMSPEREQSLAEWVESGGGVAFFLGDQVDPVYYGEFRERFPELFPVSLDEIEGDVREQEWATLLPERPNHPMLNVFADEAALLLRRMKFYRYWGAAASTGADRSEGISVLARFSNLDNSPALVESVVGEGRALVCMTAADDEWANWVSNPGYVVAMQEMGRHLAQTTSERRQLIAGTPLREPVDPATYALEATLRTPTSEAPVPIAALSAEGEEALRFQFDDTRRAGIYRLRLSRRDETSEDRSFSVNIDPDEGDLTPLDKKTLASLRDIPTVRVSIGSAGNRRTAGLQRMELWRSILIALIATLCIEQAFAWFLGRKRA